MKWLLIGYLTFPQIAPSTSMVLISNHNSKDACINEMKVLAEADALSSGKEFDFVELHSQPQAFRGGDGEEGLVCMCTTPGLEGFNLPAGACQ
jgi:hypothetical protein